MEKDIILNWICKDLYQKYNVVENPNMVAPEFMNERFFKNVLYKVEYWSGSDKELETKVKSVLSQLPRYKEPEVPERLKSPVKRLEQAKVAPYLHLSSVCAF